MNNKLYNAAHGRIHSLAMEALARLEAKLNSIDPAQLDRDIVDSITEDAQTLARLEGALITLKEYFGATPTPARREPPATDSKPKSAASPQAKHEPVTVTAEMSPTYKKSVQNQKVKAASGSSKSEKKATSAPPDSSQKAFGTTDE